MMVSAVSGARAALPSGAPALPAVELPEPAADPAVAAEPVAAPEPGPAIAEPTAAEPSGLPLATSAARCRSTKNHTAAAATATTTALMITIGALPLDFIAGIRAGSVCSAATARIPADC